MKNQDQRTLYLLTLGCAKNRVDSEVMLGTLMNQGFTLVAHPQKAQVIVVNTCAFVNDAKQESIDAILELAEQKKVGCCQTLVVAGCLTQRYCAELLKELPEVDHFLGTGGYAQLGDLLAADDAPRALLPSLEYVHDAQTPRINSMPWYTSYIKVSEGCDNACAFCIIPQIRGAQRSRSVEDIVAELLLASPEFPIPTQTWNETVTVGSALMEQQASANVQFLALQGRMQMENQKFTSLSNVMKTKHDTLKNTIQNVR